MNRPVITARGALVTTNLSTHSPSILQGRSLAAAVALSLCVAALAAAPAEAGYGPGAEAASANGSLLGDGDSSATSISDDGRYVVFTTSALNLLGSPSDPGETYVAGIVRRDMITGAVELVTPPRRVRRDDGTVLDAGAAGSSISGNGRYVLFQTSEPRAPGDTNADTDVYVRDMSVPLTDASAYELVSAVDGGTTPPEYRDDVSSNPAAGSIAGTRGFALSDDGRRAVFWTAVRSTLPAGAALAPAAQVFVRLLDTRQTLLITRNLSDGKPVVPAGSPVPKPDPVLSGNGSAVAWLDTNIAAQVPLLAGEAAASEPAMLWREVSPDAATRRVAGRSDPDDPGCPPGSVFPGGGETDVGPCLGPFASSEAVEADGGLIGASSISDDGRRVLFRSSAHARPFDATTAGSIVYLADMSLGLTRKQGVRRVLRGLASGGAVEQVTLSGDGTRVAFTSPGSRFEGARAVGSFPSGVVPATNVYVADLEQGIVQRATIGVDGSDLGGTLDPDNPGQVSDPLPTGLALSDDAGAIAFSSSDANLFLGDANGVADVQVVRGTPGVTVPRSAFTSSEPASESPVSGERDRPVKALAGIHPVIGYVVVDRHGVARLDVRVPAAGRVTATASTPRGRKRLRVSRVTRRTKSEATVHLRLAPTLTARKVVRRSRGLRVRIDVRYAPVSGRATTRVRFYTLTRSAAR